MSALTATAQRVPSKLVALALVIALAAAVFTVVLAASGGSSGQATQPGAQAAPQRLYIGGPGEGAPGMRGPSRSAARSAPVNDGSQHPGARP